LEQYFEYNAYPSAPDRQALARKTKMSPRQIEVWVCDVRPIRHLLDRWYHQFQNHRRRARLDGVHLKRISSDPLPAIIGLETLQRSFVITKNDSHRSSSSLSVGLPYAFRLAKTYIVIRMSNTLANSMWSVSVPHRPSSSSLHLPQTLWKPFLRRPPHFLCPIAHLVLELLLKGMLKIAPHSLPHAGPGPPLDDHDPRLPYPSTTCPPVFSATFALGAHL